MTLKRCDKTIHSTSLDLKLKRARVQARAYHLLRYKPARTLSQLLVRLNTFSRLKDQLSAIILHKISKINLLIRNSKKILSKRNNQIENCLTEVPSTD